MKFFLTKLFLFLLIPFLILIFLEFGVYSSQNKFFSENKMEIIYDGVGNDYEWIGNFSGSKSLLLGSSSVRYGIGAKQLTESSDDGMTYLNLAMDARDPIQTYFLLKEIDLSNVKTVYFGLDPWIYTKAYYKNRNPYLYLDIPFVDALEYSMEHDRRFLFKRYMAFFNYYISFTILPKKKNFTTPPDYGSVKLKRKPKNFNEQICETFQIEKYGWSQLQFEYLVKMANLCKKKQIEFNVFLPPKRSDYSTTYRNECYLIHQQFKNILSKLNFEEPIFGKYDNLDGLGDKELFVEGYHLNATGQDVYTDLFLKMIKRNKEIFSKEYQWFGED